jgi:hypothetical protein
MNKALEDLQAGRDPFAAAYANEPDPEPYYKAANACIWLPIVAVVFSRGMNQVITSFSGPPNRLLALGIGAVFMLLLLTSLICGIIALCGMSKHGTDRIIWRSLIGTILSLGVGVLFSVGVVSGFVRARENHQLTQAIQQSSKQLEADMKHDLENGKQLTPERQQLRLEGMQQVVEAAAANGTGDTALMAKATAIYLKKMQPALAEYNDVMKAWHETPILDLSGVQKREQLEPKRALVKRFLAANDKITALTVNPEKIYREELQKAAVPEKAIESAIAGIHNAIAARRELVSKIRGDDRRMGNALLGMLDVLDANWGHWRYDAQKQKTIFENDAALDKYVNYRDEMEMAGKEQKRLQLQAVNRASL